MTHAEIAHRDGMCNFVCGCEGDVQIIEAKP